MPPGVATLLELAEALAAERARNPGAFPRGLIFAAWSGEEIGMIGSSWFAEHPLVPLTNVVAYLNFDMVGRLRENKLTAPGHRFVAGLGEADRETQCGRRFQPHLAGRSLPADGHHGALPERACPCWRSLPAVMTITIGPRTKPTRWIMRGSRGSPRLARGILTDLEKAGRPAYAQVAAKSGGGGGRESLRAYIGTIPDYATEVEGVKLSGVRAGGPADKAGLKGGDIIVEFAGPKIANIYDYTYALDAVKIGQPTTVVILRQGERKSLTLTPETRK